MGDSGWEALAGGMAPVGGPGLTGGTWALPWGCGGSGDPKVALDNWAVSDGFKSYHPGGANFLFADGSIHFLAEDIDHMTYQLLGCRNDGRVIAGDF